MPEAEISAAERCAQLTFQARTHHRQGDRPATLERCLDALRCGDVPMEQGAILESLLRDIGETGLADQIRTQLLRGLSEVESLHGAHSLALQHVANVLMLMGEYAMALRHLERALAMAPADHEVMFLHTICHLESGTFVPGTLDTTAMLREQEDPAVALASLVAALGHHGQRDEALRLIDQYRSVIGALPPDSRLHTQYAALTGQADQVNQSGIVNTIFDKFAESYDQSLANLGNNGPQMIGALLEDLGIPKDGSLKVFDAGCGTGLCEPFLRPRARLLHGADLSVGMLEKCLAKGTYDLLCRSDLAVESTLPDDTFDIVICADVLVYFGGLRQVFANLATRLVPGGWFVFTVEAAPDDTPAPGYGLNPSGRNFHALPYLKATLEATGFDFVTMASDTLRLEFRRPVKGFAVAARKRT